MWNQKKNKQKFPIDDLYYYFDAVDRNRFDQGELTRKSAECLMLRERLMRLPKESFDQAMLSIHAIVDSLNASLKDAEDKESPEMKRKMAADLYSEQSSGRDSSQIEAISKV